QASQHFGDTVACSRGVMLVWRIRMGHMARYATALLGGVALGVLGAGAAHAQDANTKFVTLLERLVIGTGVFKVAIDTPQAVTVVDQADIDSKQASTIGEVLDDVPGVT